MKTTILALALILSQASFAAISASKFEARHNNVIETAVTENCGYFRDLTVVETKSESIRVDNGITDVKYTTVLTGVQRMDQNIFDTFEITVESEYADMYDHTTQNWGAYSVTSVSCKMK